MNFSRFRYSLFRKREHMFSKYVSMRLIALSACSITLVATLIFMIYYQKSSAYSVPETADSQ